MTATEFMPSQISFKRPIIMLVMLGLMVVYAAIMFVIFYLMEEKNIQNAPPTIVTSAAMLGSIFFLALMGIARLSRVSVWNVSAQVFPLWLTLTSIGLVLVLLARAEYSNIFIAINWPVGLALLFVLRKVISRSANLTFGVTPKVNRAMIKNAKLIDIDPTAKPLGQINAVIATASEIADKKFATILTELAINKVPIVPEELFREQITGRVNHRKVDAPDLMQLKPYRRYMVIKRISDVVMASVGFVLTLPLMLVVAVLIKLESKGSPFFIQRRTGEGGREFNMYKFRSMVQDADVDGAKFATSGDARVTRIGRVIRKLRIDELPQLVNVLFDSMSMIGPRPEQKALVDELSADIPLYPFRHAIRPGITGWAQVMQGYADDVSSTDVKLSYDLYYIKNLSLMMDFVIFFKTIKTIITGFGSR